MIYQNITIYLLNKRIDRNFLYAFLNAHFAFLHILTTLQLV